VNGVGLDIVREEDCERVAPLVPEQVGRHRLAGVLRQQSDRRIVAGADRGAYGSLLILRGPIVGRSLGPPRWKASVVEEDA
jgi:hypothetical protein